MSLILRKRSAFLLGMLLALVILAGCGSNFPATGTQQASLSSIPIGKGSDPEPGTDGKPQPTPEGHGESILTANNVTYVGSDNGQVYAFDALSGKLLWQHQESAIDLRGSIGSVIYATDARSDNGNSVYALNAANGDVLWRHPIVQVIDIVKVVDGGIYITTGNTANPAVVYALNAQTGAQVWQYAENGPEIVSVGNGRVYTTPMQQDGPDASNGPQLITALDASSGRVLWRLTTRNSDSIERGGIAEANGVAYLAATSGSVYAVQAASGQSLWYAHQSITGPIGMKAISAATPVISNGVVYTGSTTSVFAYRASDGKQFWQYRLTTQGGPPLSIQPLVDGGSVYFSTSLPGSLVALRASDGKQLWQHQGSEIEPDALALVNGLLINQIGNVTAYRTSDGSQVWEHNTDNGAGPPGPGAPVMTGSGVISIGEQNGTVRAFRLNDGAQLWQYRIQELPVQSPPVYSAFVTFTNSTSYDRAIQIIGNLGLKTFAMCRFDWSSAQSGKDFYTSGHTLTVMANPGSAPVWLDRLKAMPEVAQAQPEGAHSCPQYRPSGISVLPANQAGTYLQVSFSSGTAYTQAWESLNALGFRLANPCYEKERAQGHKPTWHPMGEEDSFGKTHTLVLATTQFNATTWHQQLQSVTGIGQVEVLSGAACS